MPGFSTAKNDSTQNVMYADNVDFSGDGSNNVNATITVNGQLLIGNEDAPFIRPGLITSPLGTLNIGYDAPNITMDLVGGGTAVEHLTGNTGGALNPDGSNNFNLLGPNSALTGFSPWVTGSGSTLTFNMPGQIKWVVNPVPGLGTHTTIQGAINSALGDDTIYITYGTGQYNENLTINKRLTFIADSGFGGSITNLGPAISGNHTLTSGCNFYGLTFYLVDATTMFSLQLNPSAAIAFRNCNVIIANATVFLECVNNSVNFGSIIYFIDSIFQPNNSGLFFTEVNNADGWSINYINSYGINNGSSLSNTKYSGNFLIENSTFPFPITTSGSSNLYLFNSDLTNYATPAGSVGNLQMLTLGSTANNIVSGCIIDSGSASAISIGSGAVAKIIDCQISSSNTNVITGSGTLNYSNISFFGSSSNINNTLQVPNVASNDSIKVIIPGAYPYTVNAQDAFIPIDSSSARTVYLPASPTQGEKHIIKDNVGSAFLNNITVDGNGNNIDNSPTNLINTNYGATTYVFNGTQWNAY